jgi:hypothetical protein
LFQLKALKRITETITAYGHPNILATHETTLEITKHFELTRRGNCIVAVKANKALADLAPKFKEAAKNENAKILITIKADGLYETICAYGNPKLTLTHKTDIVIRRSNYVCPRTLAIKANKAARDLQRKLIQKLRNPDQKVQIILAIDFGGHA